MDIQQLTLDKILTRPLFHTAKVAAGADGLQHAVDWVHVLEIVQVAPFVSRNDLILTTGLWMNQLPEQRLSYLQQLIDQQAAGLCLELGTSIDRIPEEILELAEQKHFPVIVFAQPVRFSEITQDLHSLLLEPRKMHTEKLDSFAKKLHQMMRQPSDLSSVMRLLHEYTTDAQILYYSLLEPNRFYPKLAGSPKLKHALQDYPFRDIILQSELELGGVQMQTTLWGTHQILLYPVICFGQTLAYLGVTIHPHHSPKELVPFLEYAADSAAGLIMRTRYREERDMVNHDQIMMDLLHHQLDSEEAARDALDLPQSSNSSQMDLFIPLIIEINQQRSEIEFEHTESILQDLLVLLRTLLKRDRIHHNILLKHNKFHVLMANMGLQDVSSNGLKAAAQRIIQDMKRFVCDHLSDVHIHGGAGNTRYRILDTPTGFKEAGQVIELSKNVPAMASCLFYSDMGAYQLLKAIPSPSILEAFVQEHLGAIYAHEKEHQHRLLETLDMYLQCSGSKHETARRLFIHRQTLYNRMERLQELLGDDFMEQNTRICLELALLASKMLYPIRSS
ncbi:purine catabolism regulator [Paenibacillus shirakamiensis]|uniref:Purine catabolism regulator n=1 Tax=Paenibacillus shirakamiensis TaxID=1265935 RepID=A0ABS4JGT1_9BACL|nr:PucR family transcriptional regulator [Paenibacillus shirakamiensis]MBP2000311.1 purine catabolism regulator [Paenibacillus shirakamiensis]